MKRFTVSQILLIAFLVVVVKPPYAKGGFLAGEETPVWVAKLDGGKVVYTKIQTLIVRDSINYWNSLKQNDSLPIKDQARGNYEHFYSEAVHGASRDPREVRFHSQRPVEKRSTDESEVRYPTLLVVMHYDNVHLAGDRERHLLEEHILYALAFWGTVDSSLRVFENPRVSLRIAGIIIVETRQASPYLAWNDGERSFAGSLCPMMDYWKSLTYANEDFPYGSYNIVAHMTSVQPRSDNDRCTNIHTDNRPILAVGTPGPSCGNSDEIDCLIVNDNFAFDALERAAKLICKAIGGNEDAQNGCGLPGYQWKINTLNHISNALRHATCMVEPKVSIPPGRPVPPILAGELMTGEKQCELYGYGANANTCWNSKDDERRSTCRYLMCSRQGGSDDTCERAEITLDGTVCDAEKMKICLGGECVDKPNP